MGTRDTTAKEPNPPTNQSRPKPDLAAPTVSPVLSSRGGMRCHAGNMLSLQRAAGNRAVVALIGRSAAQGNPATSVQRDDGQAVDPRVESIEGLRNVLHNTLNLHAAAYQHKMEETRTIYGFVLSRIANNYEAAWRQHRRILTAASLAAGDENMYRGFAIGVAASVAVAGAAAAIPAIAGLSAFSGGWWAATAGRAAVSGAIGRGIATHVAAPTNFEPAVPEALGEIRQLQQLLSFERTVSRVHNGVSNLGRKLSWVDVILDELRGGDGSGSASRDANDIIAHASDIEAAVGQYTHAYEAMMAFKQGLEGWEAPPEKKLERLIWVHWIGSLNKSDHDLLDRDEVEDYLHRSDVGVLGESGILGVDTREIWDTDKENAAIDAARGAEVRMASELSGPSAPPR